MPKIIKLSVELVPSTCHYSNVRSTVKPKEWDKIRFLSYEAAGHKCEVCSETGKEQGYKHNVECHEIWEYDDTHKIQRLAGLISLCPTCHQVKHIGRAIAIGNQAECFTKLAKVNDWTLEEVIAHVDGAFEVHKERSQHQWALDLSILNQEPYNLSINLNKKRVFEKAKWKKKRKKRSRRKAKVKRRFNKRPPKR